MTTLAELAATVADAHATAQLAVSQVSTIVSGSVPASVVVMTIVGAEEALNAYVKACLELRSAKVSTLDDEFRNP